MAHMANGVKMNGNSHQMSLDAQLQDVLYETGSLDFLKRMKEERNGSADIETNGALHFHIVIVGAGLGGLATAIALARRGHRVQVLEQASVIGEVGAGIQIPSNSTRLLTRWGVVKFFEGRAVEPEEITFRRWEDGRVIGRTPLMPDFKIKYGAPYLVIHRAHFHDALYQRALELGVTLRTNARVVKYDECEPSVTLKDGTRIKADFVVAADGVRSIAREKVQSLSDSGPYLTGFAAYRATVDVEKMKQDPDTASLLSSPKLNIWIGEDRHVMTYMIAGGKSFNMVLSHVDHSDPATWRPETALADMRQYFKDWDPCLTKIINMIEKTMKWPLMSGTALQKWVASTNKLSILGDAAHAMVPYMSQGAAMAVEDAAGLAKALDHVSPTYPLEKALSIFERVRTKRANQMQQASLINGKLWHFADGPEQEARDREMRPEVLGLPFEQSPNQWSDPVTQAWAYGYDAEGEIERAFVVEKEKEKEKEG